MSPCNMDKSCFAAFEWITNTSSAQPTFLKCVTDLQDEVGNDIWTFFTSLCKQLSSVEDVIQTESSTRFNLVADVCIHAGSNKEMAYILLECCEVFQNPTFVLLLIPKLCQVLLSLPYHQVQIDLCFGIIYNHVCYAHPIPSSYSLTDDNESPAVENENELHSLIEATDILLCFLDPFISLEMGIKENINHDALTCALFQILDFPLLYLRISGNPDMANACSRAVAMVARLHPTLFGDYLSDNVDFSSLRFSVEDMILEPTRFIAGDTTTRFTGLAHMLYLVFCHDMSQERVPKLYQADHKLRLILPYLTQLFRRSTVNIVAEKAINLASCLIKVISDCTLHSDITEEDDFKGLFTFCFWAAQYCDISAVRKDCIRLVKLTLSKLETDGRYGMLYWILSQKGKLGPEIMGFTCTMLKDEIFYNSAVIEAGSRTEIRLLQLLDIIYRTPDEGQSELIADLDMISAALNMARFLVKHCAYTTTKFNSHVEKLLQSYVTPIGNVMRAYRERLLNNLTEPQSGEKPLQGQPELSVTAGDNSIEFSQEMEKQAAQAALSKLDLVLYIHECLSESLSESTMLNVNINADC